MYTPYDIANHHHCAQNQPWIDVCTVFCYTVCIYVMHERKPTYFLYPHVVIPPPQFQADPRQGHWLVIGERCLWLKFIFFTPPSSHLHSHRTGLQLSVCLGSGWWCVCFMMGGMHEHCSHISACMNTRKHICKYTTTNNTHTVTMCLPPLPCSSWVRPGPRHFTSGCLLGSEVTCNGPVHLPAQ